MSRIENIIFLLQKEYPDAKLILNYNTPLQLMVASILAAQCTDERVNKVTAQLFKKYANAKDFAEANQEELENYVKTTGFFRNKAKNIINACNVLKMNYKGEVPSDKEKLLQLPGIAGKTANMILCNAFKIESGIVVDTHVKRIAYRLGFTSHTNPDKIEQDLKKIVPKEKWIEFPHLIAFHGRKICKARRPLCLKCSVESLCNSKDKITYAQNAKPRGI